MLQLSTNLRSVRSRQRRGGFSLIELLAVMALMGILMALAVPSVSAVARSSQLTSAARAISDQISLARQVALARNEAVEVRLYQYADPNIPGEAGGVGKFRAMQLFLTGDAGVATPVASVERLPGTIIFDSSSALSSIIGQAGATAGSPSKRDGGQLGVSLPVVGVNYHAVIFRFQPDGSTNMPTTGQWFLTLHDAKDGDNLSAAPANYFTVQIEVSNGRMRNFRP